MISRTIFIAGACVACGMTPAMAGAATKCEDLSKIHAPDMTITAAATVTDAATIGDAVAQTPLSPPLCRVGGFITPTRDSHIAFEVWLPASDTWNQKLVAVGNGGLSGALNHRAMVPIFNRGYATMTTDLGHTNNPPTAGEDATWALGHPEKIIDYSYRAEHLTTLAAKQIVNAFYGRTPGHSYYTGCSAGGIQGMTEVLRYPRDFDGYVIGDATPDHLGQEIGAMWNTLAASLADPANAITAPQMALVHQAILNQCVGKDGGSGSDPFLTNPMACSFDPKVLQCAQGRETSSCLTPAQVAIFEKIYQGPSNPRSHEPLFSGLTPGTELLWDRYFVGKKNPVGPDRPWAGFMTDMVYSDPDYLTQQKYLTFDFDKDYAAVRAHKVAHETLDASWDTRNRDLEEFRKLGGKIIHYHGWDDPNIPSLEAVKFFEQVMAEQAKRRHLTQAQALEATQAFYRLFMVPGMGHCAGGSGPSNFGQNGQRPLKAEPEYDTLIALENWVEQGKAPVQFIGSRQDKSGAVDMTRPICAYPKEPVWNGSGDANSASSFMCTDVRRALP